LPTPATWATSRNTPTIFKTIGPDGTRRLLLFSGPFDGETSLIRMAMSPDDGLTWSELAPIGSFGGVLAMSSLVPLGPPGRYLAFFHDDGRSLTTDANRRVLGFRVFQCLTTDGGLTWSAPTAIASDPVAQLCEPGAIVSPDGSTIAVLLRENSRTMNSFVIYSKDGGVTWTAPQQLPAALTGDRHVAKFAPDGRLVISFRDSTLQSATQGDWVVWVGTYDDIVNNRQGQYRVRLMRNYRVFANNGIQFGDCGYSGLELLPDGTFVATSYGGWTNGETNYVVSVRFTLAELDSL
jgi:hypothetical protein